MKDPFPASTIVLHDPAARRWLYFQEPVRVLQTSTSASIPALLHEVQHEVEQHRLYAAGFLAYEAAPGLDPAFKTHPAADFPLAWFGLYQSPRDVPVPVSASTPAPNLPWALTVSPHQYRSALRQIKDYIRAGDTYQVNYSLRLRAPFAGEPWALFLQMVQAQGAHYAAFLNLPDWAICSASPELFFRLDSNELVSRPMKGTTPRGLWPAQDMQRSLDLQHSEKNRAENIMIVDMVRNDLGRVAQIGSVDVSELFTLERYPTLFQLTSTIRCRTHAPIPQIFRALFPAASITGAPKVRTMEIIRELEDSPRRIYTGTIGFIAPDQQAQFNVAIRTVLIDKQRREAEYGVGGGIVWDSVPALEFEECRIKAKVLTAQNPQFALLETILWTPADGFFLLEGHLRRLSESAAYFSRPVNLNEVRRRLAELARDLPPLSHRVRLQIHPDGKITLHAQPLSPLPKPYRLRLADRPIDSADLFLYHKTTHRQTYEKALAACPGCEDVLLWNQKGELTESTIANLVIEKDGGWLTPPLHCGLLAGVYRSFLLQDNKVKEEIIRLQDLIPECKLYLVNAVRGIWEPVLVNPPSVSDDTRFAAAYHANPAHAFSSGRT